MGQPTVVGTAGTGAGQGVVLRGLCKTFGTGAGTVQAVGGVDLEIADAAAVRGTRVRLVWRAEHACELTT